MSVAMPVTNSRHTYNTRNNSEFYFALPKPKTNNIKKAFAYRGAEAWNEIIECLSYYRVNNNTIF
jgi:hypothetical protein